MKDNTISFLALIFGILLTISGIFLFILNNLTTAVGTIGLTDGLVRMPENLWLQVPIIDDSGRFGLLFALVVAVVCNSFQFTAIFLRDMIEIKENKNYSMWINIFDISFRIFDFITAFWYISHNYKYFSGASLEDITNGIFTIIFHILFVVLFLTVGSEIIFAYGLKIVAKFGFDGSLALIDLVVSVHRFLRTMENKLANIYSKNEYGGQHNQNSDKNRDMLRENAKQREREERERLLGDLPTPFQNQEDEFRRGPGRPRKNP